jgi:NAD-dependent deacetylase
MNNLPRVVVLTGAGISAESGLKTFRDSNGLWENHRVEDVATPEAFARNPSLVYRFYNARRAQLQAENVKPNQAHYALSDLASKLGDKLTLVTQNVDNLHERAGSPNVVHMHGELLSARCSESDRRFYWEDNFDDTTPCPCCVKPSLRPDIVWFGEVPMYMDEIYSALSQADIFIAIGTSGQVYPAAGFVQIAKQAGAYCVEANLEPGASNALFDASFSGLASQTIPDITQKITDNSLITESL